MPRLLDLFSGAGGCAMGYARAGFDVVGVDCVNQPHYPFEFHQDDALDYLVNHADSFDVIHASPPCHDHSPVTGRNRKANGYKGTGWMLDATVALIRERARVWVVENVETAEMPRDVYQIRLCGSSFGLDVRRHRRFATNIAMLVPACDHGWQTPRFRSLDYRRAENNRLASVVGVHGHLNYPGELELRKAAMDIDWMTSDELSQAIPPAYTEWIGEQLMGVL